MKALKILFVSLLVPFLASAQLLKSESSHIRFFSEAPLENIEAETEKATGVIKMENSQIAIIVPIQSFQFEKALMQEHFNENYMESDKFKNGTFQGKFNEAIKWKKDGEYPATATGKLNVHGVERETTLKGTVKIEKGKVMLNTKFIIKLVDHDIDIPQAVFMNIAEEIEVTMKMTLVQK